MTRRLAEGREIFNARLAESSVAVVEPDLKAFMRENLLDDQVGHPILVHIQC
jgi:hypothetical protein